MSQFQALLDRVHARKDGAQWKAHCPAHADGNAPTSWSLSLTEKNGRILLNCFAGCSYEAIAAAMDTETRELLNGHADHTGPRIVATYDYTDEAGTTLYQVVRYLPKYFRQRKPDGKGGWIWKLEDTRRVLYNLPAVLAAKDVFVVEGEKDCETATSLGVVATTCAMGAGKWREEYNEALRGKKVFLIPDADDPGRKHAHQVATSLNGKAASVKVLELPFAKDLTDWVEQGATVDMLHALAELAPVWSPNADAGLRTYTPAELRALVSEPIEPIAYPLAVRGMLSLLDGQPKAAGKTTLALHAARSIVQREIFLGRATKSVNILYVTEEYKRTFLLALDRLRLPETTSGLHIIPKDEWSGFKPWTVLVERIEQTCRSLNIGWLVVDTFFHIASMEGSDNENNAGLVDAAVTPLRSIAGLLDIAVLINRHERKSGGPIGESGRGSSALTGAADIVLRLQRMTGCSPNVRQLEVTGRIDAERFTIELTDGRFITRIDDTRTSTALNSDALNGAIQANPVATVRELAQATGIDKSRITKVAAGLGWRKPKGQTSWTQTNQQTTL